MEHFHSRKNGCEMKYYRRTPDQKAKVNKTISCGFCKTHNVETCGCGWEWGFHYGTDSMEIQRKERAKHFKKLRKLSENMRRNRAKRNNLSTDDNSRNVRDKRPWYQIQGGDSKGSNKG